MPEAARPVPADRVQEWVAGLAPTENRLYRFKWLFRDDRASTGGQGSARIAPPDSLRFDVMGPFGSNPSAAVVVGHEAMWVQPPDALDRLIPNYPLMWAMFGIARRPDAGAEVRGFLVDGSEIWQYAHGADTVEYARLDRDGLRLLAVVRHAGNVVGRAETRLAADGRPTSARLVVPSVPARLDITFVSTSVPQSYPLDVWYPRGP